MEIDGTIYKILPKEEVTFGDGTKRIKGGFVITHGIDYPSHAAFELFGEERLSMLANITVGMPVKVYFHAESREARNGNFYTTLKCFGIVPLLAQNVAEVKDSAPTASFPTIGVAKTSSEQIPPNQQTPTWLMGEDEEVPF